MKIRAVEAKVFHACRQTDMMRLTVFFHNSTNMPSKLELEVLLHRG